MSVFVLDYTVLNYTDNVEVMCRHPIFTGKKRPQFLAMRNFTWKTVSAASGLMRLIQQLKVWKNGECLFYHF
jgi:hypothetical protein